MPSAVASGWAGWALAHPELGSSVNPITARGADYAHHITASPPGFKNPAASLSGEEILFSNPTQRVETQAMKIEDYSQVPIKQVGPNKQVG